MHPGFSNRFASKGWGGVNNRNFKCRVLAFARVFVLIFLVKIVVNELKFHYKKTVSQNFVGNTVISGLQIASNCFKLLDRRTKSPLTHNTMLAYNARFRMRSHAFYSTQFIDAMLCLRIMHAFECGRTHSIQHNLSTQCYACV